MFKFKTETVREGYILAAPAIMSCMPALVLNSFKCVSAGAVRGRWAGFNGVEVC